MGLRFSIRKILPILSATFLLGCAKKDWSCNCRVNGDDYTTTIANSTKSQAGKKCGDYGKQIGSRYGSYTYTCKVN